jgi:hypothetical protein
MLRRKTGKKEGISSFQFTVDSETLTSNRSHGCPSTHKAFHSRSMQSVWSFISYPIQALKKAFNQSEHEPLLYSVNYDVNRIFINGEE